MQGMILALQNQTDQFGEATIIRPAIIIVPSGYMFDMYTLFYSPTISTSGNTQAVNPLYRYKDSITVVEDPTINALCGGFGNVMPWWLLGAKDDTDFIEVDYLNGQEIPTIRRMETPGTLGFVWDIYLDWGISVMDYRGAIKNPGNTQSVLQQRTAGRIENRNGERTCDLQSGRSDQQSGGRERRHRITERCRLCIL